MRNYLKYGREWACGCQRRIGAITISVRRRGSGFAVAVFSLHQLLVRCADLYRFLGSVAQRAHPDKEIAMYLSNESLLVILLVGVAAGWLAGHIVQGTGLGLINDMIIGVIGAFAGDWLMPQLGIHLRPGI